LRFLLLNLFSKVKILHLISNLRFSSQVKNLLNLLFMSFGYLSRSDCVYKRGRFRGGDETFKCGLLIFSNRGCGLFRLIWRDLE
jgi:hypothetical protein